jgi:hypothetical protein
MADELERDREIEGHLKKPHESDEPDQDADDEVEAHLNRMPSVRMDSPSES